MEQSRGRKTNLIFALILIGIGLWYLAAQLYPPLHAIAYGRDTWPYQIIWVGILLALVGLIAWAPGLLIPASIVGGIGGLLWWQNSTGNWESWAYAWTLIPGFVGVGLLLFGLMARQRGALIAAVINIFTSLILFGIFSWAFGGPAIAGQIWPVAVILLGVFLLFQPLIRQRRTG